MKSIKDVIENDPVVIFLTAIVVGFLAGIGTYEGALRLTDRQTESSAKISEYKLVQEK